MNFPCHFSSPSKWRASGIIAMEIIESSAKFNFSNTQLWDQRARNCERNVRCCRFLWRQWDLENIAKSSRLQRTKLAHSVLRTSHWVENRANFEIRRYRMESCLERGGVDKSALPCLQLFPGRCNRVRVIRGSFLLRILAPSRAEKNPCRTQDTVSQLNLC